MYDTDTGYILFLFCKQYFEFFVVTSRPIHRAVVTAIRFTNVALLAPCYRQPYSKNFPNHDISSQLKLSLFLDVTVQNYLAV